MPFRQGCTVLLGRVGVTKTGYSNEGLVPFLHNMSLCFLIGTLRSAGSGFQAWLDSGNCIHQFLGPPRARCWLPLYTFWCLWDQTLLNVAMFLDIFSHPHDRAETAPTMPVTAVDVLSQMSCTCSPTLAVTRVSLHVSRHVTSASGFHARWAFCQTPSLGTCRGRPRGISFQADWECQTEASWGSSRMKDSCPSSPHLGVPPRPACVTAPLEVLLK